MFSRIPRPGMHLCHAMLLPRPEAVEHGRRFAERGKLALDGATLERRGKAALVTMRNPRFLNAEDETTLDGLEIAIDVATLDRETDIAVLRGDAVEHPKYRGRNLFSAGINLTHLYRGKIAYVWYIKRDMGLVNKLFRGVARPDAKPRRTRRRHRSRNRGSASSRALPSAAAASCCSRSITCWRRATPI